MLRVVRPGRHRCGLMTPDLADGKIVQCFDCKTYWIGSYPPNPNYAGWRRLTWLERKIRRVK